MGSKRQPSPPPPPDPREIASVESQFNRLDQFTPFGNLTFTDPTQGQRGTATLELDPAIQSLIEGRAGLDQSLLDAAGGAIPGIQGLIGRPLSTGGLPGLELPGLARPDVSGLPQPGLPELQGQIDTSGLAGLPGSSEAFRNDAERAFFERSRGLLEEQFGRDEERLRQRLANQGLQAGGEAFGAEVGEFGRRRGETFENLARDAVLFGGSEASRALSDALSLRGQGFGERVTQAGFGNQAAQQQFGNQAALRGQLFGEALALPQAQNAAAQQELANQAAARSQLLGEESAVRGNQFNELASLLGLQQVQPPGLQNFFSPSPADVTGGFALQQAGLNNAFNQQSANAASAKGGTASLLGTLGGAALGGPVGGKIGGQVGGKR